MEFLLWILISLMALVIVVLIIKIYLLQKSAKEIQDAFEERLITETNTLIGISSQDPYMRKLADEINKQLRKLRSERHRFQKGDLEVKEAMTNIAHDLRTPLTAISGYMDLLDEEKHSETVNNYLEIIKESILGYYAALKQAKINPNISIPENIVLRKLDPNALARVFANIISNAIKYSDGDLNISLSEDGKIVFSNKASQLNGLQVGRLVLKYIFTKEESLFNIKT